MINRFLWSLAPLLEVRDAPRAALDPSRAEVAADIARMQAAPIALARPVLVLAGYRAWSLMPRSVAHTLASLTTGRDWRNDFLPIAYPWSTDLRQIAGRVAVAAHTRWPAREVDVVAVSMGGLVARAAAAGLASGTPAPPPLPIHRLFTLATPHQGARLALHLRPDAAARDMQPGSTFLNKIDHAWTHRPFELLCYTRLRDTWVGATRTSPAGHPLSWVHGWRLLSHLAVSSDLRILNDIARHLRGEPAWPRHQVPIPRD